MVQLNDIRAIDNGAHFHSVDLHIHSYGASHDVKDQAMTPEAIVDSAVKQGLSVIAITDHNSNANVARAMAHASSHYVGEILVLPGVEITTANGHLLAYFSPDRAADLATLLSRLDLIGEMGADNTRTAKSMADAIALAHRLGGICIAAHIDRDKTGFEVFAPGFQNWKRTLLPAQVFMASNAIQQTLFSGTQNMIVQAPTARNARKSSRRESWCRSSGHGIIWRTFKAPMPTR